MASRYTDPQRDQRIGELDRKGLSSRQIARIVGCSQMAVTRCIRRAKGHQPQPRIRPGVTETALQPFGYTDEEAEFLRACLLHQQRTGRRLRACDYLEVLRGLGYQKVQPETRREGE